jgi:hypothetical protein
MGKFRIAEITERQEWDGAADLASFSKPRFAMPFLKIKLKIDIL